MTTEHSDSATAIDPELQQRIDEAMAPWARLAGVRGPASKVEIAATERLATVQQLIQDLLAELARRNEAIRKHELAAGTHDYLVQRLEGTIRTLEGDMRSLRALPSVLDLVGPATKVLNQLAAATGLVGREFNYDPGGGASFSSGWGRPPSRSARHQPSSGPCTWRSRSPAASTATQCRATACRRSSPPCRS